MAFFAAARQARKDDAELGKGVWRRAHDRFRRGLDRCHQILEGVTDDELYAQLVPIADDLAALLPQVRALCAEAQVKAPSAGLDIPGSMTPVHRALSRAGNALATTAEAVAMARHAAERSTAFGEGNDVGRLADSVRRRALVVAECLSDAADAARAAGSGPAA